MPQPCHNVTITRLLQPQKFCMEIYNLKKWKETEGQKFMYTNKLVIKARLLKNEK